MPQNSSLRIVYIVFSVIGLGLTVIPSFLVFNGAITVHTNKVLMFIGTAVWFLTAPLWVGKKNKEQQTVNS